jgi:hypothetical protein
MSYVRNWIEIAYFLIEGAVYDCAQSLSQICSRL